MDISLTDCVTAMTNTIFGLKIRPEMIMFHCATV